MRGSYWSRKKVISMSTTMQCIFCDSAFPCYGGWYAHIMEHLRSEADITISKVYWDLVLKPIILKQMRKVEKGPFFT